MKAVSWVIGGMLLAATGWVLGGMGAALWANWGVIGLWVHAALAGEL